MFLAIVSMLADRSAISAWSFSDWAVFLLRFNLLSFNSLSHHALWSASAAASSLSLAKRALIMSITFTKGLAAMSVARADKALEFRARARLRRRFAACSLA